MITRSERSGEKRNRIFSPGRRNRREKKLPFRLSFITKGDGGRVYPFTRFVNGEEAVLEESAGVSLVENQDIWLRFDGPPDFRFTMDGLDVVTLPHAEKIDGQSYLRPGWKGEPFLLFEGRDFPLVPGYYVITVTGAGKIWRGLLEITPKFMGRQSWQAMREELVEEIKDLSFDFMKRSIHISRSMEGELGLKSAMLLRFYAISEESDRVVQVLGELARTANSRIVRKQGVVRSNRDAAGAHIRCAAGKSREGTPVLPVICSEVTWNVAENRFAKAILQKLDENLRSFVQEIDDHARRLGKVQDANAGYYKNRDFKNGANALSHFEKYRARAVHIRNAIRMVAEATWFHEAESGMPETLPMTVFLDPRYSLLYRLYRNLKILPTVFPYHLSINSSGRGQTNCTNFGVSSNSSRRWKKRGGSWRRALPWCRKTGSTVCPAWKKERKLLCQGMMKRSVSFMTALCPSMHRTPTGKRILSIQIMSTAVLISAWTTIGTERIMALSWQILNTVIFFSCGAMRQEVRASVPSSTRTAI